MTNREFYKDQILDIVCKGNTFGFDKRTNKLCSCNHLCNSGDCLFYSQSENCDDRLEQWCNDEYVEPCHFKKGELVEVSNGSSWELRYFSHREKGKYMCFKFQSTKESADVFEWKQCRKYGTLGGLVKEDTDTNVHIREE